MDPSLQPWWDVHLDGRPNHSPRADASTAQTQSQLQQPYVTITPTTPITSFEQHYPAINHNPPPLINEQQQHCHPAPPHNSVVMQQPPANYIEICPTSNPMKKEEPPDLQACPSEPAQPVLLVPNVNSPEAESAPAQPASNIYIDVAEDNTGIYPSHDNKELVEDQQKSSDTPPAAADVGDKGTRGRRGRGRPKGGNRGVARGRGRGRGGAMSPTSDGAVASKRGKGRGSRGRQKTPPAPSLSPVEEIPPVRTRSTARSGDTGSNNGDSDGPVTHSTDSLDIIPKIGDSDGSLIHFGDSDEILTQDCDSDEFLPQDGDSSDSSPARRKSSRRKSSDTESPDGAKTRHVNSSLHRKRKESLKKRSKKQSGLARLATLRKPPLTATASSRGLQPFKREPAFIDLSDKNPLSVSLDGCGGSQEKLNEMIEAPATCDGECHVTPEMLPELTDCNNYPVSQADDLMDVINDQLVSRSIQTDYCPHVDHNVCFDEDVTGSEASGTVDESNMDKDKDSLMTSADVEVSTHSSSSAISTPSAIDNLFQMSNSLTNSDSSPVVPVGLYPGPSFVKGSVRSQQPNVQSLPNLPPSPGMSPRLPFNPVHPPGIRGLPGTSPRQGGPMPFNFNTRGMPPISPRMSMRQMSPQGRMPSPSLPRLPPSPRQGPSPRGRMRSPVVPLSPRFSRQLMMGSPRGGRMPGPVISPQQLRGAPPPLPMMDLSDSEGADPGVPQPASKELIRNAMVQTKPNVKTKTGISIQSLHLIPITPNNNRTQLPEYKVLYMGVQNNHHRWLNVLSKVVRGQTQYQCGLCPRRFPQPATVHQHMKTDHCNYLYLIEIVGNKPSKNPKLLFCRHCSFVTSQKPAIWYHFVLWHGITVMSQDMPATAESSSILSTTNADLGKAELSYMCLECKAVELNRTRLAAHVSCKHPNSRMLCGGFVRLKEVNLTKVNITGGNRQLAVGDDTLLHKSVSRDSFVCTQCSVVHYREQEMIVHCMDMHSNQTLLYVCMICEMRFDFQFDISTHIRTQHKINPCYNCSVTLINLNATKNKFEQSDFVRKRFAKRKIVQKPGALGNSNEVVNIDDSDDELEVVAVTPGGSKKRKATPAGSPATPAKRVGTPQSAVRRSLSHSSRRPSSASSTAASETVVIDDDDEDLATPLPASPRSASSQPGIGPKFPHIPSSPHGRLTPGDASNRSLASPGVSSADALLHRRSSASASRASSCASRGSPASSASSPGFGRGDKTLLNNHMDTANTSSNAPTQSERQNGNHDSNNIFRPLDPPISFGDNLSMDNAPVTSMDQCASSQGNSETLLFSMSDPAAGSSSFPPINSTTSGFFSQSEPTETSSTQEMGTTEGYQFPSQIPQKNSLNFSQALSDHVPQLSAVYSDASSNRDNSQPNALTMFDTFGPEPQAPTFTGLLSEDSGNEVPALEGPYVQGSSTLSEQDVGQNSPLTTYCEAFQSFLSGSSNPDGSTSFVAGNNNPEGSTSFVAGNNNPEGSTSFVAGNNNPEGSTSFVAGNNNPVESTSYESVSSNPEATKSFDSGSSKAPKFMSCSNNPQQGIPSFHSGGSNPEGSTPFVSGGSNPDGTTAFMSTNNNPDGNSSFQSGSSNPEESTSFPPGNSNLESTT